MTKEEQIRKLKNEYHREWRKKNPDKVKAIKQKYWERKLEKRRKEDANK